MTVLSKWMRPRASRSSSIVEALYRGILQRVPSSAERRSLAYEVFRHGDIGAVADDMITSQEFTIMRLPHLMAQASKRWCGRQVFFLHIPKTAGTSMRLALTNSCGVPAVTIYRHIGEIDRKELHLVPFWPLFIGHAHIDFFPESHRGLTVVREPRSRFLSMYRQAQSEGRGPHLADSRVQMRQQRISRQALSMPFGQWLRAGFRPGAASWFTAGFSSHSEKFVRTAQPDKVRRAVEAGVARIDAAAWSHDRTGMLRAITRMTGDASPELPHENVFSPRPEISAQTITSEDLAYLDECAARDQLLIDALVARGLVEPLSSSQADDLFHTTATRLGFRLA